MEGYQDSLILRLLVPYVIPIIAYSKMTSAENKSGMLCSLKLLQSSFAPDAKKLQYINRFDLTLELNCSRVIILVSRSVFIGMFVLDVRSDVWNMNLVQKEV